VAFDGIDQFTSEAVKQYEAAIVESKAQDVPVRAMVLCNPHNPLGQCYEPEALIEYLKLCQKHKIHLISDEIYALSMYSLPEDATSNTNTVKFKSILSIDTDKYLDPNYLHVLYGFSKDLASGGLRLGCIWTRNEALISAMSSLAFFSWTPNFSEVVGIAMLENEEWQDSFIQTNQKRLGERSALARSVLEENGIAYGHRARAGFFLWIDVGKFLAQENEEATWEQHLNFKQLLKKHKVYITGGDNLSSEKPGFFRLCYVKPEAEVRTGLERVVAALKEAAETSHGLSELRLEDIDDTER
jgi:1-aminocyclopropane-1-carboxylate synthase